MMSFLAPILSWLTGGVLDQESHPQLRLVQTS